LTSLEGLIIGCDPIEFYGRGKNINQNLKKMRSCRTAMVPGHIRRDMLIYKNKAYGLRKPKGGGAWRYWRRTGASNA
jgi:hypothetical protein